MTIYQYLPFIMISLLIASIISSLFLKKKDLPVELFVEGLRYENDGHFDEAIINYENALSEVKRTRFHRDLENRISKSLKYCIRSVNTGKIFSLYGNMAANNFIHEIRKIFLFP
jgi:hypothetical protein